MAERRPLKISQLRALIAVADHGNFSTAALELNLSQSTVSHAIATLEEDLGVVLLVRGRHGAILTAIGEQIVDDARQVMGLLDSMQKKASLDRGLQSGQVRVASVRSIASHVLPDVIVPFRQKFPRVNVVLSECIHYVEAEQALLDGRADIALTTLPTPSEFESWELLRDEFLVLLPPNTLDSDAPLTWEQLVAHPMIMTPLHHPHEHARSVLDHAARFGYTLNVAYEVKEDSTVIGLVKRGLGVGVMARLAAEPIPDDLQVRSLPVPLERVIGAATLANALLPRSTFAFLDMLKAVLAPL